jgi:hypothetical protein
MTFTPDINGCTSMPTSWAYTDMDSLRADVLRQRRSVEDHPNYHSMELADTMWSAAAEADPVSDFVKKTRATGIFTEVHQYGGFSHGYTSMPYIGTRDVRMVDECLEECLTYEGLL